MNTTTPTPGAMRAARHLSEQGALMLPPKRSTDMFINYVAETIDRESGCAELLDALRLIECIPNMLNGGDWDEIEQARQIARAAIARAEGRE